MLPVINDQKQSLIEWDETGASLYYTDESFPGRRVEAYYFYKNENDDRDIHTLGGRVSGKASGSLSFAGEMAVQLGKVFGRRDILAAGRLRWTLKYSPAARTGTVPL